MATKKFSEDDIRRIYKKGYKIPINWDEILENECLEFIELFEKATNSSKTLTMSALIPLVATICGPDTAVESQKGAFRTPLNSFIFSVCAPGGGKSITYDRVIAPVIENYRQATGLTINLETYTAAGIHNHQIQNKGVGIITSDEGHRFLSSVQTKQKNGESERAFLCKVWGGKGDYATLSGGSRGFEKTSLSMCILIQPQPLLSELTNMQGSDGFLDRFIFLCARPCMQKTSVITEAFTIMQESRLGDFVPVFENLRIEHSSGKTYILTEEAEEEYAYLVDSFADYMNSKYDLESDDDECTSTSTGMDNESPVISSSKDTQHILRLSAIIHIMNYNIRKALGLCRGPTPIRIDRKSIQRAKSLFHATAQQKNVFVQALQAIWSQETVRLPSIKTFRERLLRVVLTTPGPALILRNICNKIKGSTSDNVQEGLRGLEKDGFGWLRVLGGRRKQIFAKVPPSSIERMKEELLRFGVTPDSYRTTYNDESGMETSLRELIYTVEFQREFGISFV